MKKLLSICFLSMLLGLLSFGVRAQNDNGCTSGFWIENLQPDTIYGVVNMPPDGKLPLIHTLGTGHFNAGGFVGNATFGNTELYELHFCNTCGLDPKTKVSIDWVLLRENENGEWEEVNDNLSNYAEFGIYTFYNHLNQYGECQSIDWLGGRVFDGFGYCDDQTIGTGNTLLDTMAGVNGPCFDPTNYPGAMHVEQGTPMAVLSQLGQIVPAAGQVNIYSQNHDYFYMDFFEQTRNIVVLKWKQAGNYKLVMRVRQRLGGTPWMNEFWKQNPDGTMSEVDYVGGHQSCCGPVLVEDTIGYPTFGEDMKEVCADENALNPFVYGRPPYTFTETMPDTNVVFGEYRGEDPSACFYFHTDSVNRFHFFVRENPQVQAQDIAICKCTEFGQNELNALVTMADTANKGVVDVRFEWATNANGPWSVTIPTPPTAVGVYHFFVRQVNIYQTIECTGDPAEIVLTINELPAPTGGEYEICNEDEATTMTMTVNRDADVNHCSTTSVWFLDGEAVHTGDTYVVNLADVRPTTNVDKVVTYHVKAYNAETDCYSAEYSIVTLTFHQTPEIELTYLPTICPHAEAVDFVMVVTSTQTEFPYTVAQSSDFTADYNTVLNSPNTQETTNYTKPYSKITDFECGTTYHLYYEVTDDNGCFVKDTATFVANDVIAPEVNPATWARTINICNFEGVNRPDTIKTIEGFDGLTSVSDNCGIDHFTCKDSTYVVDACENVLVRTYTFYDYCNNASTFTQTFTAHDSVAPYFVGKENRPIYERLAAKRDTNCTFNSLSKAEFVMAFLGKVEDNCVEYDSAYLYNHSEFYWEESSRFGHVVAYDSLDIFRDMVGNQLTVEVVVWDDCGNTADTLAFWFEPDTLKVGTPVINPNSICLGDTAYLTFDSNTVDFGIHFDVAHPLTFQWGSLEDDSIVNFTEVDKVTAAVSPLEGDAYYHLNITVTDAYGCSATSDYARVFVKANPNIVIVPHERNISQPPYCPNVGIVWLAARDASNPSETVPNLTYQWTTSQSVNILSDKDTTGLWIVPDSCTYIYDAQVFVTDTIYGCTAEASILVPVEDVAPEYIGGIHHDIVPVVEDCKMLVTDFVQYVVDSLYNACGNWPPKKIWQEPAVGTEMTEDTPVTVYVVSQCGDDTLAITCKFVALADTNRIKVTATVDPREACSPALFTFAATSERAIGPVTYTWTKGTEVMSNNQTFSTVDSVEAGVPVSVYVYQVEAVDSVGCKSTDTVHITVNETLPEPEYEVFPNTRCEFPYNGIIRLIDMPKGYVYELFDEQDVLVDAIITQIPVFDYEVPTTSIIFDELEGDRTYTVRITTTAGCVTEFDIYVPDARQNPSFHGEVTTNAPTFCTNDNGSIVINKEQGFTYYVFNSNQEEVLAPYMDLHNGDYIVYKVDNLTACQTDTLVTINPSEATLTFTVTSVGNTLCGGENFNGTLTFNKANIQYVVTNDNNEVIYEGLATTVDSLAPGMYHVHGTDMITGCENTIDKQVLDNTVNPDFTVTPAPNQYCDNEEGLVNGHVTITASGNYTYEYFVATGATVPAISIIVDEEGNETIIGGGNEITYTWGEVTDPTHLAANHYKVVATDANGCQTELEFDIVDSTVVPVVVDSTVVNTICDNQIAAYDGKVILTISNYNNNNKPYTVTLDTLDADGVAHAIFTSEDVISPVTFNSLNSGTYHYTVTDKYMCVAEGQVTVEQQQLPDLVLKQTPNTYCVGTYNKPGNGTITVMAPYDEVQYYYYSYFYAPEGQLEKGDEVEVDYDNLINRFYWLVDTFYYVEVMDLRTGCVKADTITVELGRDTVLLTGDPTPNTFCIDPFNGQIQLHTTFKPAEFDYSHLPLEPVNIPEVLYPRHRIYNYSIDNGLTYQSDSLFTNLEDGVYYITVLDSISGCVYNNFDSIVIEKTENDIVIVPTVTPNHACDSTLYDGKITVTATSEMFNPAQFEFSFEGGEFSTVNTWNSLAPDVYHIVAREINSGCENSIDVVLNTENECTPIIDIDVRKYCLNEENATITAHAYYPEGSDCEGDFTYRWHKECHNEYFDGATAPVATDEEMCCFYTVTATNTLTGCFEVSRVEVCVYAAHAIVYTVDLEPITGNSTTVCENEDLTIGVVHNGWEQAWWTMNHITDTSVINPEYEFYVNTADSVAAYKDDSNKWKFNKNVTFCLDVIDTNGCRATGLFNLVINPLVRDTVYETVCELPIEFGPNDNLPVNPTPGAVVVVNPALDGYDIDDELMAAIIAGTVEYPYSVSRVDTIPAVEEGCDTVLTTTLTVMGYPTITGEVEESFCEGTTIAEVIENITITNAAEGSIVMTLNGEEVSATDVLEFNPDGYWLNISCYSYADQETQMFCGASEDYDLSVSKKPDLNEFELATLCAGGEIEINVPEYVCNSVNGCTVSVVMVDSTDAENVVVTVLEEDYDDDAYLLDPIKLSYNGKYIGFKVTNECGDTTVLAKLIVDTIPVGHVNTAAICANQTIDASYTIDNEDDLLDPENVVVNAYLKKANETEFTPFDLTQTVDYSFNGAELFFVLSNAGPNEPNNCGSSNTDTATVTVSDKPTVELYPDPYDGCDKYFDVYFDTYYCGGTGTGEPMILQVGSPMPGSANAYVLPNGSEITAHGWLLVVENDNDEITYQSVTAAQIKALAYDSTIYIKYFATNACGSDTAGPFMISISDEPELTVTTGTICPNSSIMNVVTYTVDWHSDEGEVSYVAVKDGEDDYEISANTTFEDVILYNGGEILVIAENVCGADTEHVALNIPTFNWTEPEFQAACVGSPLSDFIETAPTSTITVATIVSEGWYAVSDEENEDGTSVDEAITLETLVTEPIQVYYKWVTSCGDEFTTDAQELELLYQPEVTIEDITICEGSTVDIADAHLNVADDSQVVNGDPTWTINGEAWSATNTYGVEYDNADIVVTIPTACDPVTATAKLHVNPNPVVEVEGPEKVCDGTEVTFIATQGFETYTFTLNDGEPVEQTSNEFVTTLYVDDDAELGTTTSTVTVSVTDENGCSSTTDGTASVIVSNQYGFIFTDLEGNPTHEFTSETTQGLQYKWMVSNECNSLDTLVWVEYEFYHNGVALTNESPYNHNQQTLSPTDIENFIQTMHQGPDIIWNTKNEMDYQVGNSSSSSQSSSTVHDVSYYFGSRAYNDAHAEFPNLPSIYTYYGNHFPYSNLNLLTTTNYYDDLWIHFLVNRPITQTIAPFLAGGEYTVVFKLYSTDYRDNWQTPHTDYTYPVSQSAVDPYGNVVIGGHAYAHGTPKLLVVDSIHITVGGLEYEPAEPAAAPALAPDLNVDASNVAPEMEVWPNPAPAITTTLKARVHNMSGDATVTLNSLSGTQIYAGKTYIDSDNYYFEFDVNHLSVGTYVLTVRTNDAIITKKVVVSALAR